MGINNKNRVVVIGIFGLLWVILLTIKPTFEFDAVDISHVRSLVIGGFVATVVWLYNPKMKQTNRIIISLLGAFIGFWVYNYYLFMTNFA